MWCFLNCRFVESAGTDLLAECLTWGLVSADTICDQPVEFHATLLKATVSGFLVPAAILTGSPLSSAATNVICKCNHNLTSRACKEGVDKSLSPLNALLCSLSQEFVNAVGKDLQMDGGEVGTSRFRRVVEIVTRLGPTEFAICEDGRQGNNSMAKAVGGKLAEGVCKTPRDANTVEALVDLVKVGQEIVKNGRNLRNSSKTNLPL